MDGILTVLAWLGAVLVALLVIAGALWARDMDKGAEK